MPELMAKPELSFSSFPFAGNVYRELLKYIPDDNFGYSPIALATLLGLARSGCREETAHEIKSGLNFPTNPKEIETVSREIYSQLKKGKNFHCYVANRIYIEQSFPLKMDFKNFSEEVYQIEIEHINFKKLDECRLQINDYVKNATQGQVEDFIDVQEIDPLAKCIIASGVYFKMNWFKFIQKESVSKQKFITISGKSIEVEFMEKTGLYNYFESSELKSTFLEIPIENGFDLVIVLPDDKKGLLRLETRANDVFSLPNYSQTRVKVSVPKFSFSFKFDYRRVLQHLGIYKAFTSDADMNGFLAEDRILYINHVIHKTVFVFSGESTDAQAVQATSFSKKIGGSCKTFTADHPFVFYIKCKQIILFAGRVLSPS